MFEHLKGHKKILVTGPHRSGTTIAATMIARDTKRLLTLEERCHLPKQNLELVKWWLHEFSRPVVVQAPFVADSCHMFNDDVLVVFMMRNPDDIIESQKRMKLQNGQRVGWESIQVAETRKYHTSGIGEPISVIKYREWELQKQKIKHYLELPYNSLKEHPLWLPKEKRQEFHVRQVSGVG